MKKFLEEQRAKLEKRKQELEKELGSFARKNPELKDDWKTKFPDFGVKTPDFSEEADQVEEYEATLPVEYVLETDLQKINKALEGIKKGTPSDGGTYGVCQNCKKKISIKRLKAYPEADTCLKCIKT